MRQLLYLRLIAERDQNGKFGILIVRYLHHQNVYLLISTSDL